MRAYISANRFLVVLNAVTFIQIRIQRQNDSANRFNHRRVVSLHESRGATFGIVESHLYGNV